jgi:alkylhydroperoxidase family enzyme
VRARVTIPDGSVPIVVLAGMGTPALAAHNNPWGWQAAWNETELSVRERELWRVRLAHLAGIERGSRLRFADLSRMDTPGYLSDAGIPEEFYAHIFDSSWQGYSSRERLILRLIEQFSEDHEGLRDDDAFWAEMHAHFNQTEIVDLTCHMIGPQLGRSRMAKVLLGCTPFQRVMAPQEPLET